MEDSEFFGGPWADHMGRRMEKMRFMQAGRGDMRGIVLRALLEKPMHGYEVIRSLEESSNGMWRPSPGSIYPMLTMLEEEDLVEAAEEAGKKVYSLTDAGKKEAESFKPFEPWKRHDHKGRREVREVISDIFHSFKKIMRSDDEDMQKQAMEILQNTRDQLVTLTQKKGK